MKKKINFIVPKPILRFESKVKLLFCCLMYACLENGFGFKIYTHRITMYFMS